MRKRHGRSVAPGQPVHHANTDVDPISAGGKPIKEPGVWGQGNHKGRGILFLWFVKHRKKTDFHPKYVLSAGCHSNGVRSGPVIGIT